MVAIRSEVDPFLEEPSREWGDARFRSKSKDMELHQNDFISCKNDVGRCATRVN